jgi:hypothetical protein
VCGRIAAIDCIVAWTAAGGSIMADPFTCPIPHAAETPIGMRQAARKWELIALRWRNLAERRRAHHLDLYRSGRWKLYYTDEEFLTEMRSANAIAQRWALIAPLPEERTPRVETQTSEAA